MSDFIPSDLPFMTLSESNQGEGCNKRDSLPVIKGERVLAESRKTDRRPVHRPIGKGKMKELERQIAQVARGDRKAFETVYERTKSAVYGLALSITRRKEDAEDVMQETYLRVHRGAGGYKARGKPMAWILTITRHLALDLVRSAPARDLPLEVDWLPDPASDFSEAALDRMVLEALLTSLKDDERQILVLRSTEGLKHKEIAKILDLPLGTVLSKYHRALSKLRKMLEEESK